MRTTTGKTQPIRDLNEHKLEDLQGKVLGDVAGSLGLLMAYMGDRLDLYSARRVRRSDERAARDKHRASRVATHMEPKRGSPLNTARSR